MRIRGFGWSCRISDCAASTTHERPQILQFMILPAMMNDAHENYRNRARRKILKLAGSAAYQWWDYVAAHISCAAASQLPALLLGDSWSRHFSGICG